eukprot:scaffold205221_cov24-Prasinocladus_malaysianus.AAC.1
MDRVMAVSSIPGVLRSLPLWTGIDVPVVFEDEASLVYGAKDLKYLLFKGTKMKELGPPQERKDKFLATDYMMQLVCPCINGISNDTIKYLDLVVTPPKSKVPKTATRHHEMSKSFQMGK